VQDQEQAAFMLDSEMPEMVQGKAVLTEQAVSAMDTHDIREDSQSRSFTCPLTEMKHFKACSLTNN
jgi:hypothetical protein